MAAATDTETYVVGVDFGTLSGPGRRGAGRRRGRARHRGARVPARRHRQRAAGTGDGAAAELGAAGAGRLRRRAAPRRARGAVADAGVDPADVDRHRHRLHRLHRAADARRRHAAVRARRVGRPPARLRQALEAPRRPAAGRPHQRARRGARASPGWRATAAGSPPSGSSPRRCSCSRRTREVYAATERWIEAADWIVWQLCGRYVRNACTAGYKGIRQDGALPVAGSSSPR